MAKTESTAVNQLIANIQGRPLESDVDDDLGFEERTIPQHEPGKARPVVARTTTAGAPAMAPQTAVPPPMPRSRSASGTEVPALNGTSRSSTARAMTIPPLPNGNGNGNSSAKMTMHGTAPGPKGTRTSTLPPPLGRTSSGAPNVRVPDIHGTPAPEVLRPSNPEDAPAWLATPVPAAAPAATPPVPALPTLPALPPGAHARPIYPIDATAPAQLVDGRDWFESSSAVPAFTEADIGTQGVRGKKKTNLGFLIGTAFVCALAGVFVGGYLVFDGAGGAKAESKPAASLEDQGKAAVAAAAAEPARPDEAKPAAADPAAAGVPADDSADDKAEPAVAAAEPAKTEPAPAAEPAKTEPAKTEPAPAPAPVAAEPAKTEPAKTEPTAPAPVAAEPAKTALAPAAEPAPAVAATGPAVEPGKPVLVDVLFLSNPPGASVVLVDGGRTIPIGSTPVSASIDVAHSYEAVFALEGHQTRIAQLDPRRDRRFTVDLKSGKTRIKHGTAVAAPSEPVAAVKKDSSSHHHNKKVATVEWSEPAKAEPTKPEPPKVAAKAAPKAAAKPEVAKVEPTKKEEKAEPAPALGPKKADGGPGLLMVAAKPPCEIIIDGKATGLTTPQRSIDVPAGTHKITLVNKDAGIKKTIAIKVTAGKATKLIQDYTSEMKK